MLIETEWQARCPLREMQIVLTETGSIGGGAGCQVDFAPDGVWCSQQEHCPHRDREGCLLYARILE